MSHVPPVVQVFNAPQYLCTHHLLEDHAKRTPDAPAIVAPGHAPLTYGRLQVHVDDVVQTLHTMGLGRNDRVALILPNGPEMAVAFLSVAAGATCTPLNPAYSANEFDFYLADLNAKALIIQADTDSPVRAIAHTHGISVIELSPTHGAEAGLFTLAGKQQTHAARDAFAQPDDVALVLHTAGTTSRPKIVPLTHTNICTSAYNRRVTVELTESDRCLNVLPLFHIHGLLGGLLASLVAGASIVCTPGFDASKFFAWLAEFRPTWYTAVPAIHQAILVRAAMNHEIIARCPLRFIRSGSAALPPQVLVGLERAFNVPVVISYGMTEAPLITSDPLPPHERKAGSVGVAAGPEVAIMGEMGVLLPVGEIGEIVVRGSNVFQGYDNNPTANQSAFTDGWFRTGDQGYLDSDGYLFITGRLKEIISRGGEKIAPWEVDDVLMDHPAVAEAVTFAVPDPRLGEEIAAAIVLHHNAWVTASDIRQFAVRRLPAFKVPRQVLIVQDIPKGPTGKVQRVGLAEKLGVTAPDQVRVAMQEGFTAPRTPLEEVLAALWAQVLNIERVGIYDDFFQLGGDSLLATQLLTRMREVMHVEVSFISFFDTPTVAEMVKSIETDNRVSPALQALPLQPVPRNGTLPLSYAQQRLWFLEQLGLSRCAYNLLEATRLLGVLDVAALAQSLREIVRRHEVLRTTFTTSEGQPRQVIRPTTHLRFPIVDLQEVPACEREAQLYTLAREEAQRPFDLAEGPLLRTKLLRLGTEEHVLLLTMHHIVSDGWSHGVFWRELAMLYEALATGKPSPLPDLSIQYTDFAHWQLQWLRGEVLNTQVAYWEQQLTGLTTLQLPIDRPRPAVQTLRGMRHSLALSPALTQALKTLSLQHGVTVFMTLLAAFQTLLHRYAGQDDIPVGTFIANRNQIEIEGLIGFFINTLVLRTDLSADPSFRELLGRVRGVALGAYSHQDLPFEKLLEELRPQRDLSQNPLFQVLFNFHNTPRHAPELPGLSLSPLEVNIETARFDVELDLWATPEGIRGWIEYSTDLFEATTIARMAGHFQTLLEGIVADPEQCLSTLPLLTASERHRLLVEWNNTAADYPQDKCIHELFEAQVEWTPDAMAVVFEGEHLTYRELNRRANQLAHYLRRLGVGSNTLVGICMECSLEMMVGLLGILKAGGAYVPLDPAYPQARLAFMLEDTRVPVLLTQKRLVEELPKSGAHVVCLDADREIIDQESAENPVSGVKANNSAYAIYTSGSTGTPKGVLGLHRGAVNRLHWMWETYPFAVGEVCCRKTSLNFVDSVWETFGPLLQGIQTIIIPDEVLKDPQRLIQCLAAEHVTRIVLVPSLLRVLLDAAANLQSQLPHLKMWISSGETLSRELIQRFQERLPQSILLNLYGSSEVSADSTWYDTKQGKSLPCVPIGRPIGNTQIYLLDRHLQPVPIGVPGELYIGGAGLAQGYLNRPKLTAEKFIPNPFSNEPGARLYKTEDLARYLPDGNLEFLGRIDHQVNIRGFRIELGEIEAVLGQHPAVQQAVVVVWEDALDDARLVAYVVPQQEPPPTSSALRSFLQQKLPEHIVPSAFVLLAALPLTPNGKLDRRALPTPDWTRPALADAFVAPRNKLEQGIAEMWQTLLGIEPIGIHDNFFELGGHSLLAIQVISRLRQTFQVELPVHSVFEAPTVAKLAEHLETIRRAIQLPPILPVVRAREMPLSFAQQRLWFLDQLEPGNPAYHIPLAYRVTGRLNVVTLERSLGEIVRRHEILRTTFSVRSGQPVQVIAPDLAMLLPVVDLRDLSETQREAETQRLATAEARQSFDLTRGPLVRVKLLRLAAAEHIFLLTMHHMISDIWSIGIFLRELSVLYAAFAAGKPSPLPELPIQYADFACWERQWLQGEVLEAHRAYWKPQLAHMPVLRLPTNWPRPAVPSFRGATQSLSLPAALSAALKILSQQEGVTLFMTLLAAFQALLHRYTGHGDISVWSPVANRNRVETEGLIGFFVNMVVLRIDLADNPSFRELLRREREVTLAAYDHQDVPFEQLLEELQLERLLSHTSLFQVMFGLLNTPREELTFPGTIVQPVGVSTEAALCDLTLRVKEAETGLTGVFEYSTDVFDMATMTRLLGHFRTLLEGIVANPEQRLSELPLLTAPERHRLLVEWNDTRTAYPQDTCLHQLFEAQVELTPHAIAVIWADECLTYVELNRRANQLACHLCALGVGPEVFVGLCVERSLEMVVGMLAILKAGGAYVPLDPADPPQRLAFMLEDTRALVVLTQEKYVERVPPGMAHVVCVDSWQPPEDEGEHNLSREVGAANLAYVLHTAGSTGTPQGVAIEHRSAVALLHWAHMVYDPAQMTGVLASASICSALSVFEIFVPLCWGGKAILARNVLQLPDLPAADEVTLINTVPATLAALLRMGEIPASVRTVNLTGEPLRVHLVRQIYEQSRVREVYDLYGLAEGTTYSTSALRSISGSQTVGRPIANTQIYILDACLQPVPIGVPGELYIGGASLARGYLNRPELTAERFMPHPFSNEPGVRLYKTGDVARYRPDGTVEYMGRLEHQVTMRGRHIELGAIEAVLSQHPAVCQAVVLPREDAPGDVRLVAYIVPPQGATPTSHALRSFLSQKLPYDMIPSAFVVLATLPLTPNGIIDRQALPVPEWTHPEWASAAMDPENKVEQDMAELLQHLLGVESLEDIYELLKDLVD